MFQGNDNNAFMAAYNRFTSDDLADNSNKKNPIRPFEARFIGENTELLNLTSGDRVYEKFFSKTNMHYTNCFIHVSKTRCKSQGRLSVQRYVNTFKLRSHSNGYYPYCPSPLLQPLLYGWFPISYIPMCPKLEWMG